MKKTGLNLITSSIMCIELSGCSFGASMHAQFTSMNVDCNTESIQVSDDIVKLSGEENWTATCNGKTYDCDYFPESDSNCYLRDE